MTIRYEFNYDGGGLGKGGTGTIFVNGEKVAEGRIDRTQGYVFSADEGADVGVDGETPVTEDYKEPTTVHRQDRQGDGRAEVSDGRRSRRGGAESKSRRLAPHDPGGCAILAQSETPGVAQFGDA